MSSPIVPDPRSAGRSSQPETPAFGPGSGAAAILSVLPQPIRPVPGDSFNDRILLLLAAVATSEGLLTYRAYQLVQEAARAIFGERALHAEMQAKLHHALLHPPEDAPAMARNMAHEARARNVSAVFVDTLLAALDSISAHAERIDDSARSLVREIDIAFRKSRLEQDRSFGLDVGQSLTSLRRLAERALPEGFSPTQLLPEKLLPEKLLPRRLVPQLLPSRFLPSGLFSGSRANESGLLPQTSAFNAEMEAAATSLERIAWTLDDARLREELHAFKKILRAQPFKIVVVGERKRGKSSLVNAIIGRKLSPVRESTPETATVLEFRNASAPDYSVRFLDTAQFSRLEEYLAEDGDNLLLARKVKAIRDGVASGAFTPGKWLSGISCLDELDDYVSLHGRFSGLVARVSVGLPLEALQGGVTLVDTPGLNDPDRFHDYLAYEESLEADCVLFVMDARDPGSRSELDLLRRLARSGRVVHLVGVLANIDRLNDSASLGHSLEQARTFLLEACRSSEHVRLAGLVALNAREAADERCKAEGAQGGEMDRLLRLLREVMERDSGKLDYRRKTAEAYARIVSLAQERIADHMEAYRASLPGNDFLIMIDAHARQLHEAALRSLEQARQVVQATGRELDARDREAANALARLRETLALRLMEAVNRKVTELGHNFARDDAWKDFDNDEARVIARQVVDAFLDEQRAVLRDWEEKLRLFSADMETFSRDCLDRLSASVEGLPGAETGEQAGRSGTVGGDISNTAAHFLVQSHRHMKHLAMFTAGLAAGRASALGSITLLVTAGNILALTAANPAAAVVFAAVAGTAGLVYHLGREDRRKAAFLEKKRREVDACADRTAAALAAELETARTNLGKAYELEVRRSFAPALESLFQQAAHVRLFLDVMQKIRADADRYEEHVRRELAALRRPALARAGDAASASATDEMTPDISVSSGETNACPTRYRGN